MTIPTINKQGALALVFKSAPLFEGSKGPKIKNAYIALDRYSSDDVGSPCLTVDCVSFAEFKGQVNYLREQLDTILVQAERRFAGEEPS